MAQSINGADDEQVSTHFSIALAVGVAAIAGTIAATKTVHLGSGTPPGSRRRLAPGSPSGRGARPDGDRAQEGVEAAAAQVAAAARDDAGHARSPVGTRPRIEAQRVVYVRPAPIIRHVRRPGGEHEADHGAEQDGGGGFDD